MSKKKIQTKTCGNEMRGNKQTGACIRCGFNAIMHMVDARLLNGYWKYDIDLKNSPQIKVKNYPDGKARYEELWRSHNWVENNPNRYGG